MTEMPEYWEGTGMGKIGVIGLAGQTAFLRMHHFPLPGETVSCNALFFELGGKGFNQAVAASRMCTKTLFIGAVGKDSYGRQCRDKLESEGIETILIEKNTPTAFAVVSTEDAGGNEVAVFRGAAEELKPDDLYDEKVLQSLKTCNMLLLQNELSIDCRKAALKIAKTLHIPVILNPAPADIECRAILSQCDLITPNMEEAKALLGISYGQDVNDADFVELLANVGVRKAVITDGAAGALIIENGNYTRLPAVSVGNAVDTTGAGDVFNAALASGLVRGDDLLSSARLASIAAGISVTRYGAAESAPTIAEIYPFIS